MTDMNAAPFSTPESRAALESLKDIVRANAAPGMIEAHAFRLVGEPQAVIDGEIHHLYEELRAQSPPLSHSEAFGVSLALREVIRDRIREIEGRAA
jgi:hypothetical protein